MYATRGAPELTHGCFIGDQCAFDVGNTYPGMDQAQKNSPLFIIGPPTQYIYNTKNEDIKLITHDMFLE